MSGLFFGNRDISVSIQAQIGFQFEVLNKSILFTDEDDVALTKLNGQTAVSELEALLKNVTTGTTGISSTTDTITEVAHGLVDDDVIIFTELTGALPLAVDTNYYVINATADTFQLSASLGGAAITITTDSTSFTYERLLSDTAPNLLAAMKVFIGQTDNSGNSIIPEYVYVFGKTEADSSTNVDLITAVLETAAQTKDFYYLIPVFESQPLNTWFATWGNTNKRIMAAFTETQNKALLSSEQTNRGLGIYDPEKEGKNAAWVGYVGSYESFIQWKWKKLSGVNVDELTDGEVSSLEDAGWNGYREVRGRGETTGSRTLANTSDNASYIDEIIIRDNIIYNVAGALHDTFRNSEIVPLGQEGKALISRAMNEALAFAFAIGLIEEYPNGSGQFEVTVPDVTAAMRSSRTWTGIEFWYVPRYGTEKVVVTGQELLEVTE